MTRFVTAATILAAAAGLRAMAAEETTDMNVTHVALFSSGVGYFECDAEVNGNATAELAFRTDQINDILKSLVVQDFGGGAVGIVSYATRDPIEKTLRSFGVDITGKPTLGELLDQLRGEQVEIEGPRKVKGVIVKVEEHPILAADGKTLQVVQVLTLLTDDGLEQLRLSELQGIKLTSEKVDSELRKALMTLTAAHNADKKSVVVHFDGTGPRKVRAAYLLEAPIWKTSYRLVLADDKKPFLQGWATVENATEKDWSNVHLSLVSGRPISFRMDLYTPLYVPRPMEQLELYASLRPPEYEGGVEMAGKAIAAKDKAAMRSMARAAAPAMKAPAPAGGMVGGTQLFQSNQEANADAGELDELRKGISLGGAGVASVAAALEAGELFQYVIKTPVSIPRQQAAMLPIVNQEVEASKVSIFNPVTHPKYPLNGLELTNSTPLNLMQGPVTIFDHDTYAGDAKLPDLKPNEKRLVAYALDLAAEIIVTQKPVPDEIVSLRIAKGTLIHRHKYVDQREYTIKNKAEKAKTLILEQPYSAEWKLVEPKEPYERTAKLLRFKTTVPASETQSYKVVLERVADESLALSNTGLDQIQFYLRAQVISPKVKEALQKVITLRKELDDASKQRADFEQQYNAAVQEQARVRENLKVLQQNTDAYQRQLKLFDDWETKIGKLHDQVDGARAQENQKRQALEAYLLALDVE